MKNILIKQLIFATLVLVILLPNCKKEQMIIKTPEPIDTIVQHITELGTGTVLRNGVDWPVEFLFYYYGTSGKSSFQIRAKKTYPNTGLSESLFIQDIPSQSGVYKIQGWRLANFGNKIPEATYTMSNYDEGIGTFFPDTTRTDNGIEILSFDTIPNEVEGRFQVFMGKNGGLPVPGVPDSVFLTEGKFYLKLQ